MEQRRSKPSSLKLEEEGHYEGRNVWRARDFDGVAGPAISTTFMAEPTAVPQKEQPNVGRQPIMKIGTHHPRARGNKLRAANPPKSASETRGSRAKPERLPEPRYRYRYW